MMDRMSEAMLIRLGIFACREFGVDSAVWIVEVPRGNHVWMLPSEELVKLRQVAWDDCGDPVALGCSKDRRTLIIGSLDGKQ